LLYIRNQATIGHKQNMVEHFPLRFLWPGLSGGESQKLFFTPAARSPPSPWTHGLVVYYFT